MCVCVCVPPGLCCAVDRGLAPCHLPPSPLLAAPPASWPALLAHQHSWPAVPAGSTSCCRPAGVSLCCAVLRLWPLLRAMRSVAAHIGSSQSCYWRSPGACGAAGASPPSSTHVHFNHLPVALPTGTATASLTATPAPVTERAAACVAHNQHARASSRLAGSPIPWRPSHGLPPSAWLPALHAPPRLVLCAPRPCA